MVARFTLATVRLTNHTGKIATSSLPPFGWNAHSHGGIEVGPDEGDKAEVEAALAEAHRLTRRHGFRPIVIVLEHDDLWDPKWGNLFRP